jgi:aerobic carbon-monoxide dehydrogenase small subunit
MTMLALNVNGRAVAAAIEPRTSLADFLRDTLDLTGTHLGCEHGVCGACTLLIDGAPARSCITLAVACAGAQIVTIEGLDDDEIAIELRAAFAREHALQCGYCTPGMLISARDLAQRLPEPDERRIRTDLSGNLCRCTGYVGIVRAVRSVIADRRARGVAAEPDGGRKGLGPVGSGQGALSIASAAKTATIADESPSADSLAIPDFTPSAHFEQRFDVAHPPQRVFAFFADTAAVAACLPGASLTGRQTPERAEGAIRVKIGPIVADFHGAARIDRDPKALSGRIVGIGADRRSRSSTQGEIRYRLTPIEEGAATSVDLWIGYRLKGLLAQVGRTGLVRDFAARMIGDFQRNLDARLSSAAPQAAAPAAPALNGVALVLAALRERAARLLRRMRR